MYRFDNYIKDFLYSNRSISLEGIGAFALATEVEEGSNAGMQTVNGVSFQQNKRAVTTEAFVPYVAEKEGKNKLLVASDIESFLSQTRQFINIGRPFVIEGVGIVKLGKNWQYEFVENTGNESQEPDSLKRYREKQPNRYTESHVKKSKGNNLNVVVLIITLVIIGGIIASIYYYMKQDSGFSTTSVKDSTNTVDTSAAATTTAPLNPVSASQNNDSANYRFVFETTANSARAYKRYRQLANLYIGVNMDSTKSDTSTFYKLYVAKKLTPSDTLAFKDSLAVYFGRKVHIEK